MKTTSADGTYIDYWQEYGTGSKSHFGIRIWADRCSAISNVGSESPNLLGVLLELPIDLSRTVFISAAIDSGTQALFALKDRLSQTGGVRRQQHDAFNVWPV
jgi:hypothetical protein